MTFETIPINFSSVNSSLMYVVYDANAIDVTKLNYKYVCEVWLNIGATQTKVFQSKVFPRPDNNRGEFDISAIVREYCVLFYKTNFGNNEAYVTNVQLKIREEYNGTVGAVVATSTARTFYNYYAGRSSVRNAILPYFDLPCTNRPRKLYINNSFKTPYYVPVLSTGFFAVIDTAGTSTNVTAANGSIENLDISSYIINTTGNQYITIAGQRFDIDFVCGGLYNNYLVHFINKWGGIETMLFNKVSKTSIEVERKTFQQLPYRVDGSGVVSYDTSSTMHTQKQAYGVGFTEKLKLSTDLLTDAEYQWLSQLVLSPYVWLQGSDNVRYPVTITQSNYEFKQHIVDGLFNLVIDVEFGEQFKTQFS